MGSVADTFLWCAKCWLHDRDKPVSNYGGECCTIGKERKAGKMCDFWIRQPETWDKPPGTK